MSSYYYVKDKNSELGYTPVTEDNYVEAIFRIVKKNGVKITDGMILKEVDEMGQKRRERNISYD